MRFRRELETRGCLVEHAAGLRRRPRGARPPGRAQRGSDPRRSPIATCARYAAALSQRGLARSSVARKLTAVRSFHDHLVRAGAAEQNPAELLPTPKAESTLPRVLGPDEIAQLLESDPGDAPRLRSATARCSSSPTPAACARRRSWTSILDSPDFEAETLRVDGKGSKTRLTPIGEPAQRALAALPRARPARARAAPPARQRSFSRGAAGGSPHPTCGAGSASGSARPPWRAGSRRTRFATRSRRTCWRGGRPAIDPGAARPREHLDHPDLHPGRAGPASPASTHEAIRRRRAALPSRAASNVPRSGEERRHGDQRQGCGAAGTVAPLQAGRTTRPRASGSSSPTRRWSSSSPAAWPPGCPRTSRSRTSSPTASSG